MACLFGGRWGPSYSLDRLATRDPRSGTTRHAFQALASSNMSYSGRRGRDLLPPSKSGVASWMRCTGRRPLPPDRAPQRTGSGNTPSRRTSHSETSTTIAASAWHRKRDQALNGGDWRCTVWLLEGAQHLPRLHASLPPGPTGPLVSAPGSRRVSGRPCFRSCSAAT